MDAPFQRALVTGAGAFIGTHLSWALARRGVEVHAVTLNGRAPALESERGVIVHQGDVTDLTSVEALFRAAKPDAVFHLAAYGTLTSERDVRRMIDVNITGTQQMVTVAAERGCKSFVYAGSAKEYACSRVPITEDQLLQPWDNYAATKGAAEFFCRLAAARRDWGVTVLRLAPAYGPGEDDSRFFPTAMRAALQREPFHSSVGPLVRNFTYVSDIVEAFMAAATRSRGGFGVYNIASPEVHSFEDVLSLIGKAVRRPVPVEVVGTPARDDSWVLDSSRARVELKWEARVGLQEGLQRMVEAITATTGGLLR